MFLYNLITVIEVEEMFQQGLCLRCQSNLRMNTTHTVSIFRRSIHIQIEVVHVIYNCLRVHATLRVKCNMPFDSSLINTNISFAINPQYVDPHSFTVARILLMRLFIMPDVFVVVCSYCLRIHDVFSVILGATLWVTIHSCERLFQERLISNLCDITGLSFFMADTCKGMALDMCSKAPLECCRVLGQCAADNSLVYDGKDVVANSELGNLFT